MTKDAWIQRAKALLFDCAFSLDASALVRECENLINQAGGYDPEAETSKTSLKWPFDERFEQSLVQVMAKPESQMTQEWLKDK